MSISSTSTPSSFIDDGVDFEARAPASTHLDIAQWIDSASTIFNTNSYIDDGADLLLPDASSAPAFGPRNPKFYEDRGPKTRTRKEKVHPGVLRAADEQIKNVLRGRRELGKFRARGEPGEGEKAGDGVSKYGDEGGREGVKPVRIPARKRQPTFVLHGDGGHVVVVDDEDDPIDSRPPPELLRFRKGHRREMQTGKDGQKEHGIGLDGQAEHEQTLDEKEAGQYESGKGAKRQAEDRQSRSRKPDSFEMSGALGGFPDPSPNQSKAASNPNLVAGFGWNAPTDDGEAVAEPDGMW